MAKKTLTLATLQAVFGTEDHAPIKIVVTAKRVSAQRDDVTLNTQHTDIALIDKPGEYALTFKEDGTHTVTFMNKSEKAVRQSPAFDTL